MNTISISNNDDIAFSKKNYVGNINPDGTFELDIPLHYPQINKLDLGTVEMGDSMKAKTYANNERLACILTSSALNFLT